MTTDAPRTEEASDNVVPITARRSRTLRLNKGVDGQLWASRGDESAAVWPVRCFPWSEGARFVSLRDREEEEFALVNEPDELDDHSREALEGALAEAGFLLEITKIIRCDEEVEIWNWLE